MIFFKKSAKCKNCPEMKYCRDASNSWFFFVIGIIATIAVRLVGILENYGAVYSKTAWYIGIVGFFIFFVNKFRADTERAVRIRSSGVMDKLGREEILTSKDYELLGSTMCGITTSKDRINYFFIFSTSIITLAIAVYLDFIK